MTQGEFKKHISDTNMTGYYERDVYYVSMEEVHKLVDEAKKDFPLQPRSGYTEYVGKIPDITRETDIWQKMLKEVSEWFEKWFGSDEKK